ncbi:hypothetical protein JQK15_20085 [Sphingobium sp. BHU LFT2]|uniref:hypothetical protein n=1 Tax=Sphingobium sp. BHU LFT2 TaxID=2807634 RepID=UPI001BECC698|nr:hypothetical protein [Sphingobium sp. BHU LFT2]MBT2245817.1 hypothetical protein [Sphingobium sp. BHU LFT2]
MKFAINPALLGFCLLSACSAAKESEASQDSAARSASSQQRSENAAEHIFQVSVASSVQGVAIEKLTRLPKAPASGDRTACEGTWIKPQTRVGRQVAAAGWRVTGEARIGAYQAVSFAGDFNQGTSGSCDVRHGNVGFFRDDALVAIAYAPASAQTTIGSFESKGSESQRIRLWDGDISPRPIADVEVSSDGDIAVQPVAGQDKVCKGHAAVPNIFGQPISQARAAVQSKGWQPIIQRADRDPELGVAERGYTDRFPEVESCAGTGFGYCNFEYRQAAGTLSVTTVGDGDDPTVSHYRVACAE